MDTSTHIDTLGLTAQLRKLRDPHHTIAHDWDDLVPNTYAAGYSCGYSDAIDEVLALLRRAPEPPKATGNPPAGTDVWSDAAKAWFARAQRGPDGVPYVS